MEKRSIWNKVKDIWNQLSREIQNTFLKYPSTIIFIIITTLLHTAIVDINLVVLQEFISPFLVFLCIGFFFGESVFQGKIIWKIGSMVITAAMSLFMAYGIYFYRDEVLPDDTWLSRFIVAYSAVLIICGIYACYRRSKYSLPQYGIRVFANLIKIHIVYVILMVGTIIISGIIHQLFIEGYSYFSIIGRTWILVTGLFYVPAWIYAVLQVDKKVESFAKIVVAYVLLPLTILLFVIIYVYILKILILRVVPSNQIFFILTALFVMGMPSWTMMEAQEKYTVLKKIAQKLPAFFAPLILLQIYSVGIRVMEFGMTPDRYLGVVWIILEVVYLIIHWKKKESTGNMMLVGAGALVISLLVPYINMYQVSVFSQRSILEQYQKKMDLSQEMKKKIYGAYQYLSEASGEEEYMDEHFTADEIKEIISFREEVEWNYSNTLVIRVDEVKTDIDIREFSRMKEVECNYDYGDVPQNFDQLIFTEYRKGRNVVSVDAEELIQQYIEQGVKKSSPGDYDVRIDSYYQEHCEIEVDQDTVLIISDFEITYNKQTEEVEYLNIRGYVLYRGEE